MTNGGLFTNAGGASLFNYTDSVVGSIGCAGAADDAVCIASSLELWDSVQATINSYSVCDSCDDNDSNGVLIGLAIGFGILSGILLICCIYLIYLLKSPKEVSQLSGRLL